MANYRRIKMLTLRYIDDQVKRSILFFTYLFIKNSGKTQVKSQLEHR